MRCNYPSHTNVLDTICPTGGAHKKYSLKYSLYLFVVVNTVSTRAKSAHLSTFTGTYAVHLNSSLAE